MKLNSKLVAVRADNAIEQDENGIYIQEEWRSLPPTAVVLEVAPDVTFVQVGDRIEFTRYTAIEANYESGVLFVSEDAILAVLDEKS